MSAARARRTDPTTSHQAAATVTDITLTQANILALFHSQGTMTDEHLADVYQQMVDAGHYPPVSPSGLRSRRSELVRAGRLADSGQRQVMDTGRLAIGWGIATTGQAPPRVVKPATRAVLDEVLAERRRQDTTWGQQNHPDGTGTEGWINEARDARHACQEAAEHGDVTWLDVALEEVAEAFAEADPARLRAELIQVAAVCVAWVEAIDRRPAR